MKTLVTAVNFLGRRSVATVETSSAATQDPATIFQCAARCATGCTNWSRFGDILPDVNYNAERVRLVIRLRWFRYNLQFVHSSILSADRTVDCRTHPTIDYSGAPVLLRCYSEGCASIPGNCRGAAIRSAAPHAGDPKRTLALRHSRGGISVAGALHGVFCPAGSFDLWN